MRNKTSPTNPRRNCGPCQFTLYDEGLQASHHGNAYRLITLARELLLNSPETEDDNMLLAKASQGTKDLLLVVDRDNYEFVLRMPGGRIHVAGGNLAEEMKSISTKALEQMMTRYLTNGTPIRVRTNTKKPRLA